MLRNGLTDEQARNIATDEDATLVLAGAGTGKTAVITGKIAHLVRNLRVPPESILALAYNRKAALEIRERLPRRPEGRPDIHLPLFRPQGRGKPGDRSQPSASWPRTTSLTTKAIDGILARMMTDPRDGPPDHPDGVVVLHRVPGSVRLR